MALECLVCEGPLSGRQTKYDSPECAKKGQRAAHIWKTYGITVEEYDAIWEFQGGKCPICGRKPRKGETFHVDHEHREGQSGPVRGIVCPFDNTRLIGRLKDHSRAQALADYLREPPATKALGREVIAPGRPRKKRKKRVRA